MLPFNVNEIMDEMTPAPAGTYTCYVKSSVLKDNKSGTGKYIQVMLEVLGDGEHAGKVIYDTMNVVHSNAMAAQIGRVAWKRLCTAANITDTVDELSVVGTIVNAKVIIENDIQYGDRNVVKGYSPANQKAANAGGKIIDDSIPF